MGEVGSKTEEGEEMKLNISLGNRKMGAIPSFSLPAGTTCSQSAKLTCHMDGCYATAMMNRLPNVRAAYEENLMLLELEMNACEDWLNWYFDNPNAPRLFRLHVSGDFYSYEYFKMWVRVIRKHPLTKFMAFTKQFDVVISYVLMDSLPVNLTLIASAWPDVPLYPWVEEYMPIAYMQDGTETRIPADAFKCDGNCDGDCLGHCWNMKPGDSVWFKKHGPNVRKKG